MKSNKVIKNTKILIKYFISISFAQLALAILINFTMHETFLLTMKRLFE